METYAAGGSLVSVHHLDGSTHEHRPGGVVVHLAADGQVLGVALGGINGMLRTNGSWMVLDPDGTDRVLTAVGNRWIDYGPDGTTRTYYHDGVQVRRDELSAVLGVEDASGQALAFTVSESSACVVGTDGHLRTYNTGGILRTRQPNDTDMVTDVDGNEHDEPSSTAMTVFAGGVTRTDTGHGGFVLADLAGNHVVYTPTLPQVFTHTYTETAPATTSILPHFADGGVGSFDASGALTGVTLNGVAADANVGSSFRLDEPSGNVHVWFANGCNLVEWPDGRVDRHAADGSYTTATPEGVLTYDTLGRLTRESWQVTASGASGQRLDVHLRTDGALLVFDLGNVKLDSNGRCRIFVDGRLDTDVAPDGQATRYAYTDATQTASHPDGTSTTTALSGLLRTASTEQTTWTIPGGPIIHRAQDGTISATLNGASAPATLMADGRLQVQDSPGRWWALDTTTLAFSRESAAVAHVVDAAGNQVYTVDGQPVVTPQHGNSGMVQDSSGFTVRCTPDLTIERSRPDQFREVISPDGSRQVTWPALWTVINWNSYSQVPAGSPDLVTSISADGSTLVSRDAQGNVVGTTTRALDGTYTVDSGTGVVYTLNPDLTRHVATASGVTMEESAFGREVWTLPGGTVLQAYYGGVSTTGSGASCETWRNDDGSVSFRDDGGLVTTITRELAVKTRTQADPSHSFSGDNRYRILYPDGKAAMQFPDGSLTFTAADGTLVTRDSSGALLPTTLLADGSVEVSRPDGSVLRWGADNASTLVARNGVAVTFDSYLSSRTYTLPGGLTLHIDGNGNPQVTDAAGSGWFNGFESRTADGGYTFRSRDGRHVTLGPDLNLTVVRGDGSSRRESVASPDGSLLITDGTGFHITVSSTGTVSGSDPYGNSITGTLDTAGNLTVHLAGGLTRTYHPDLSDELTYASGLAIATRNDGTFGATLPDGTVLQYGADGTLLAAQDASAGALTLDAGDAVLAEGSKVRVEGDTIVITQPVTGEATRLLAGGDRLELDASGIVTATQYATTLANLDGTVATRDVDGTLLALVPVNGTASQAGDGTWVVEHTDGSHASFDSHGTLTLWSFTVPNDGLTRDVLDGGSIRYTVPGGAVITRTVDVRTLHDTASCPDGTVTLQADGTIHLATTDGRTVDIAPDLTLTETDVTTPPYQRIQHVDGSCLVTNYDGTITTLAADGSVTGVMDPSGVPAQVQPDGSYQAVLADGSVSTFDAQGRLASNDLVLASGDARHKRSDGTVRYDLADGTWIEVRGTQATAGNSEGSLPAAVTAEGAVQVTLPDGRWVADVATGLKRYRSDFFNAVAAGNDPERTLALEVLWSGEQHTHQADGSVTTRTAAGVVTVTTAAGEAAQLQEDASFTATLSDGTVSRYDALGHLVENSTTWPAERSGYRNDGTTFWEFESGVVRTLHPGGQMTWTVPTDAPDAIEITIAAGTRIPTVTLDGETLVASWATSSQISYAGVPPLRTGRLEIELPDGSHGWLFMNGLWMQSKSDGTGIAQVLRPDGICTTIAVDGTPSSVDADGVAVATTSNPDGSFTTTGAWGGLTVTDPDTWTWQASSGAALSYSLHGDHLQQWTLPDGLVVYTGWDNGADGWQFDGWTPDADVSTILYQDTAEDGSTTLRLDMDGRVTTSYQNGSTVIRQPDGSQVVTRAGADSTRPGVTAHAAADGSLTLQTAAGASIVQDSSGREVWTFAEGYRVWQPYGGSLQFVTGRSPDETWTCQVGTDSAGQWTSVTLHNPDDRAITMTRDLEERTTTPWGVVYTRHAAGGATWNLPGGAILTQSASGSLQAVDASGQPLSVATGEQGTVVITDGRGIVSQLRADESVLYSFGDLTVTESTNRGGQYTTIYTLADGIVLTCVDGALRADLSHDGFGHDLNQWGSLRASLDGAGNIVYTAFDGQTRVLPNLRHAFGHVSEASGTEVTLADGTRVRHLDSGIIESTRLSGQVERLARNGLLEVDSVDGSQVWRLPDGTWVQKWSDGTFKPAGASPGDVGLHQDARGLDFYVLSLANDSFRTVAADGTVYEVDATALSLKVTLPNGEQSRQAADGTFTLVRGGVWADIPTITHANPDGSTVTRDGTTGALTFQFADTGTVTEIHPDGTTTATTPSGTRSTYDVDGYLVSTQTAAGQRSFRRDGSVESMRFATGVHVTFEVRSTRRWVYLPDGRFFAARGDSIESVGKGESAAPPNADYGLVNRLDGTISLVHIGDARTLEEVASDYTVTTYDADGKKALVHAPDGTTTHYASWGGVLRVDNPDGTAVLHQADGSLLTLGVDGQPTRIVLPDQVQAVRNEDETWQAIAANGAVTTYSTSGSPIQRALPDSTGTITYNEDGSSRKTAVDGKDVVWYPSGYVHYEKRTDGGTAEYDTNGHLATVTYSATNVDHYQHNDDGTVRVTNSSGEERLLRADGSLLRRTAPDYTITTYDSQGRRAVEVRPDVIWTRFAQASDGSSIGTRSDGQVDSYDAQARLTHSVLGDGRTIDYPSDAVTQSVTTYLNGLVQTVRLDGTKVWNVEGYSASCDAQGAWTAVDPGGSVRDAQLQSDGSLRIHGNGEWLHILASGSVQVFAEDGTIPRTTLSATGTRTVLGSDGCSTVTYPDSSQEIYDTNKHQMRSRDVSGVTTVYNMVDGSMATVGIDGHICSIEMADEGVASYDAVEMLWKYVAPDGTATRFTSDGSLDSVHTPDGAVRTYLSNGHSLLARADGSIEEDEELGAGGRTRLTIQYEDGTVETFANDMVQRKQFADGSVETRLRDGSMRRVDDSGNLLGIRTPDGTSASQTDCGEWTATDGQGLITRYSASGDVLSATSTDTTMVDYAADGGTITHYADTSQLTVAADGTRTLVRADGTRLQTNVDGTTVETDLHGTVTTKALDGSETVTLLDGTSTRITADGDFSTSLPDGTSVRMPRGGTEVLWLRTPPGSGEYPHVGHFENQRPDGTWLKWNDGRLHIAYSDDTWKEYGSAGLRAWKDSAGDVTTVNGTGFTSKDTASGISHYSLPDGTVVDWSVNWSRTQLPDGSVVERTYGSINAPNVFPSSGTTFIVESDYTVVLQSSGGGTTRVRPDGFTEVHDAGGTVLRYNSDGSSSVTYTDGSSRVTSADGSKTLTSATGTITHLSPDGAVVTAPPYSTAQTALYPDGRRVDTYSLTYNRNYTGDHLDGSSEGLGGLALTISFEKDGTIVAGFRDGGSIVRDSSGNLQVHEPWPSQVSDKSIVSDNAGGWIANLSWRVPIVYRSAEGIPLWSYSPDQDPMYKPIKVHWFASGETSSSSNRTARLSHIGRTTRPLPRLLKD